MNFEAELRKGIAKYPPIGQPSDTMKVITQSGNVKKTSIPDPIAPTIRQVRSQFGANVREDVIVRIAALSTLAEYSLMTAAIKQLVDGTDDPKVEYTLMTVVNFLDARAKVWEGQLR